MIGYFLALSVIVFRYARLGVIIALEITEAEASLHYDSVDIAALLDDIFHCLRRHVGGQVADKHLET